MKTEITSSTGDNIVLATKRFLEEFQNAVDSVGDNNPGLIEAINPDISPVFSVRHVKDFLASELQYIGSLRREEIAQRTIDPKKLEEIEALADNKLLTDTEHVAIFSNYTISTADSAVQNKHFFVTGISKGELVSPPMGRSSSDYLKIIGEHIAGRMGGRVWQEFHRKETIVRSTDLRSSTVEFWNLLKTLAADIPQPTILFPQSSFSEFSEKFVWNNSDGPRPQIERKKSDSGILWRVEGMDVFPQGQELGKLKLFSGVALQSLIYSRLQGGHIPSISYEEVGDDPFEGRLRVQFCQKIEWRTFPIYDVRFPT